MRSRRAFSWPLRDHGSICESASGRGAHVCRRHRKNRALGERQPRPVGRAADQYTQTPVPPGASRALYAERLRVSDVQPVLDLMLATNQIKTAQRASDLFPLPYRLPKERPMAQIRHIAIVVDDAEATAAFYTSAFG